MDAIAADLSFGLVDGQPVFADLREDRYFMLEPADERAFLEFVRSNRQPAPAVRELLSFAGTVPAEPVACARPRKSALEDSKGAAGATIGSVLKVWQLTLQVKSALRSRPLAKVLAESGLPAVRRQRRGSNDAAAVARRFAAARRMVPIGGNCLSDSLALLLLLTGHGFGATLVFGVKLDPFAAHCWLQTPALLLNDRVDRVERFTPVRILECMPALP